MAAIPQRENIQEEQAIGKAYDTRILRRLWTYISPHRRLVWMSLALVPVIAGVEILQPLIVKYGIDHNLSEKSLDGLGWVVLAFAASLLIHGLFQYVYLYILNITGQRAMRDLRKGMFRHLQHLPNSFFDKSPLGRIMTRLTNDVESLNEMFASGLVSLIGDFVKMVGIVAIMLTVNFRLALVTFSIVPVLFFLTWIFRMRMREAYRTIRVKIARINAYLQESLSGMQIVQLYVREGYNLEEFSRVNAEHREANYLSIKYDALLFAIVEAAGRLTIALVIWYGAGLVYTHLLGQQMPGLVEAGITIGTLYAFIDWIGKFFEPIRDLSAKYAVMQAAMASSERIFELLDTPVERDEPEESVHLEDVRGEIEFRNVTFAYNPGDVVLRDLSFTVKPGEKIAVVGHTGAGKTTIIRLLSRFYEPQSGEILLDGVNIRNLRLRDLRRRLGVVLQDVFIFSGDIDYNIRLGNPEITQQQARDAARNVNADRFIQRLPRGYHEELRERGGNLSVGQRQLLSFARALAYDPAILILDEATSSVDTETELLIQAAVRVLMRGRTSIVIAHRLSTIRDVDRILVLHKGRLREAGTHADLLAQRGIYYKLYELQYRDQGSLAQAGSPSMPGAGGGS
jgi:ATP-binding cassette subfamily B protein